MRINYISNYRDGTAWSKAATYNILAIKEAGHDVCLKSVKYNDISVLMHPEIEELENNKFDKYDMSIYQCLPSNFFYEGRDVKNVGMVSIESKSLYNEYWKKKIGIMDYNFTANESTKDTLSALKIKSDVFKQSFDFDKAYSSQKKSNIKMLNNMFNFIFIGDTSKLSNLESVLIAFHSEFDIHDQVNLIIKSEFNTEELCNNVKKNLKLSKRYKREITLLGNVDDDSLYTLLRHCNAAIYPQRGIGWCQSALECMAIGLPIIYAENNGLDEYVSNECSLRVKSNIENCYASDGFEDLLTGKDQWVNPDINSLK